MIVLYTAACREFTQISFNYIVHFIVFISTSYCRHINVNSNINTNNVGTMLTCENDLHGQFGNDPGDEVRGGGVRPAQNLPADDHLLVGEHVQQDE